MPTPFSGKFCSFSICVRGISPKEACYRSSEQQHALDGQTHTNEVVDGRGALLYFHIIVSSSRGEKE
jgi:hypothetical protein